MIRMGLGGLLYHGGVYYMLNILRTPKEKHMPTFTQDCVLTEHPLHDLRDSAT